MEMERLFKLALGAGSKGVVSGFLKGLTPMPGVTPDILTAFVGWFLAGRGGDWFGPFGEGMLIASVGQMVAQPIEGFAERLKKGGGSSNSDNPGNNGSKEASSLAEYNKALGR